MRVMFFEISTWRPAESVNIMVSPSVAGEGVPSVTVPLLQDENANKTTGIRIKAMSFFFIIIISYQYQ